MIAPFRNAILTGLVVGTFFFWGGVEAQETKLFELLSSKKTGINFKNAITETQEQNALTYENLYNGGGVAVGDINNDGLDDIYFVSNMGYNKLYLNLGNFEFQDITKEAGVGEREGWKTGVAMVDINGDDFLDIYVCYSGKQRPENRANQLFINNGDLTFDEKAKEYGLDDPSYSTQAAFFDYDRDGDMDLFLLTTNVIVIREREFDEARNVKDPYAGDKLFRNDNGKFIEVTTEAGIKANALGYGLGVAVADINQDGWLDVYVSNDYIEPDYLYINNGNGTFTDKIADNLQHISSFSMGSDIDDFNNDGWPDIITLDMLPEDNRRQKLLYGPEKYEQYAMQVMEGFYHQNMRNMLQMNNANGTFSEIGQLARISNTDWSWAPLLADYDNDGWKDLFVTNGYFRDYTDKDFLKYKSDYYFKKAVAGEKIDTFELANSMTSTPLHNYIFKNNGDLTFSDKSMEWGFDDYGFSNGCAYSDLDNDGDLDLIVNNHNEKASIYKNLSREILPERNYITLRLLSETKNTRGWGSKVFLYAGGKMQYAEQMPVRGYQSCMSDKIHFGLEKNEVIDSIKVVWLSGKKKILENVTANQLIEIYENTASEFYRKGIDKNDQTIFSKIKSPIDYRHVEYGSNDFKRQPLLTTMLSNCGPVFTTGDVNGDDLLDIYVCGVKQNPGALYFQNASGTFSRSGSFAFKDDVNRTDADAIFIDMDNDGDLDLYIASGGYHNYQRADDDLQDRLYINNGSGIFTKRREALPEMKVSKSCVEAADFDKDGYADLFIGGRVIPGQYPVPPESFLLQNDGKGDFKNVTDQVLSDLNEGGMVTDAAWLDVNNDEWPDLIVVGEFMPVRVFVNESGKNFREATDQYFDHSPSGFWSKIKTADFDNDGDQDLLIGNFGLNSQLKASIDEPITLVYKDFDNNGTIDPILSYYIMGKSYPFASRDELLDQIYGMRKKFTTYSEYADADVNDIFSSKDLRDAPTLVADELRTTYFENTGGKFVMGKLPLEAQFSPVYAIEVLDYNNDGNPDFLLAGNQSAIRIRMGLIDANYGELFKGDGKGNFKYVSQSVSGLKFTGDVKELKLLEINNSAYLLGGINNRGIEAYKLNK